MLADQARRSTSSASANIIAPDFAISAPEVVLAAIAARTDAHPPRIGGDGAQHRRSGARLPALLDAQRDLERARRGDPRPRIVHRVVSALRLRPRRLRACCSRRSSSCSRSCSTSGPVTWTGRTRAPLTRISSCTRRSSTAAAHVGRRRRQPGVGGPRRAPRPAADARDHRRQPAALRAVRRPLPAGARSSSASRRCRSACTRRATSPPTDEQAREELWPHYAAMMTRIGARARLAAGDARRTSIARPDRTARCASARRRPSRARSPPPSRRSAFARFDMKYSNGTLPHDALMRSIELYGTEVAPRVRELLARRRRRSATGQRRARTTRNVRL